MDEVNDFTIVGLFCFLIAGLILGGFLSKVKDPDLVSFWRNIPLETKNRVIKEYEMYAGGLWLFLGTALQIVGYFKQDIMPLCIDLTTKVIILGGLTIVLFIMTPELAYKVGSRKRRRRVLENVKGEKILEDAEKRIEEGQGVTKELNQLAEGMDISRKEGESDKEYLERLRPFFVEVMATNQDNKK